MKRPSFQFYPGDWLRDFALRSCSSGARGLWIDLICLMVEGEPFGHLKVGSKVILTVNLPGILGLTLQEAEGWMGELEEAKVFSRTEDGVIYSRRMVRDEEIRRKRAAGGPLGGNPALLSEGRKDNLMVNLGDNLTAGAKVGSSSSSSSSSFSSAFSAPSLPSSASADPGLGSNEPLSSAGAVDVAVSPIVPIEDCPYEKIRQLHREICPQFPQPTKVEGTFRDHVKARWRENPDIEIWRDQFQRATRAPWLNGSGGWHCPGLRWIVNKTNWEKIAEGQYEPKTGLGFGKVTEHNLSVREQLLRDGPGGFDGSQE
jgi:hypothetical protein